MTLPISRSASRRVLMVLASRARFAKRAQLRYQRQRALAQLIGRQIGLIDRAGGGFFGRFGFDLHRGFGGGFGFGVGERGVAGAAHFGFFEQALDQILDARLVGADLLAFGENHLDQLRTLGDDLHNLDDFRLHPLGDFDLLLAGQQFGGVHVAHIHPHRIGGAAHADDRRNGGVGLLLQLLVRRLARRFFVDNQIVLLGRFFEHGHAHIEQGLLDNLDGVFDARDFFGQIIVDLAVGHIAALVGEFEQLPHALAHALQAGRGENKILVFAVFALAARILARFAHGAAGGFFERAIKSRLRRRFDLGRGGLGGGIGGRLSGRGFGSRART